MLQYDLGMKWLECLVGEGDAKASLPMGQNQMYEI